MRPFSTIASRYGSCPVYLGEGIINQAGPLLEPMKKNARIAIVADKKAAGYYGAALTASLRSSGFEPILIAAGRGEACKNLKTVQKLWLAFAKAGLDKNSFVIALGGGALGDAAAFACASYMRGIGCVQIPTTLLAQIDSSMGGKSAVNVPNGKNLAGFIAAPAAILSDPATLASLDRRQLASGLAEAVKYGAIASPALLDLLDQIDLKKPFPLLSEIIGRCIQIKASYVQQDECEQGVRLHLNFGHTFGHALEAHRGFKGLLHGEAVAWGMLLALQLGARLNITQLGCYGRLRGILNRLGLAVKEPREAVKMLAPFLANDKKKRGNTLHMAFIEDFGQPVIRPVPLDRLQVFAREALWRAPF